MITINKYPIEVKPAQILLLPMGARILSLQTVGGQPVIWALVNDSADLEERLLNTYAMGTEIFSDPAILHFVGTYQMGSYIGHVFEQI